MIIKYSELGINKKITSNTNNRTRTTGTGTLAVHEKEDDDRLEAISILIVLVLIHPDRFDFEVGFGCISPIFKS